MKEVGGVSFRFLDGQDGAHGIPDNYMNGSRLHPKTRALSITLTENVISFVAEQHAGRCFACSNGDCSGADVHWIKFDVTKEAWHHPRVRDSAVTQLPIPIIPCAGHGQEGKGGVIHVRKGWVRGTTAACAGYFYAAEHVRAHLHKGPVQW